ncbi:hypothetical protein ACS0TY_004043 [Phlomoides rotata]
MGNTFGSISSGIGQVIGKVLGHPLEFLSGKSCDSKCGSTWDVICYIENFCVAHLLKLIMVAALFYFVLLFLYLLFNLGICQCICRTLFRMVKACFTTYFSVLHFCCTSLCHKLGSVKRQRRRRRRRRDVEEFDALSSSTSTSTNEDEYELGEVSGFQQPTNLEREESQSSRRRNYRNEHLRRSLRPNTHRAHVELSGNSTHHHRKKILKNIGDHSSPTHHHLRVARSSKFSRKGSRLRTGNQRRRSIRFLVLKTKGFVLFSFVGIYIINIGKTWEKLQMAASVIVGIENPQDIIVQSARPYGQRAVLKFTQYTGAHAIAGRHTPGTFTNRLQTSFSEPRLLILTDPRTDHQPIKETALSNIPTIAFCDTDSPMRYVDIDIPANNKGKHSIGCLFWLLARMVLQMRGIAPSSHKWDILLHF